MFTGFIDGFLSSPLTTQILLLLAAILGGILVFSGIASLGSERSAAAKRMRSPGHGQSHMQSGARFESRAPTGLSAALIPTDATERFEVGQELSRAGFRSSNAIVWFYVIKLLLGIGLPLAYFILTQIPDYLNVPSWMVQNFGDTSALKILQVSALLCGAGFFGPSYWLRGRIQNRKRNLEEAFPNTLDLLQVGIEAGMGFDQVLLKVATEIQAASPEMAEEILTALSEIHAGRDRDVALLGMARRTGIDEVASFVNVVLQSAKFGSSLSDVLTTYAAEMRETRELKAQEKANKLPVQMSAVMAALMLPSLIALILAPIVIRYTAAFG